jgi:hypothetical protein
MRTAGGVHGYTIYATQLARDQWKQAQQCGHGDEKQALTDHDGPHGCGARSVAPPRLHGAGQPFATVAPPRRRVRPAPDEQRTDELQSRAEPEHPGASPSGIERAPATGPAVSDTLTATACKPMADRSSSRSTTSDTSAENTGQRMAKPTPPPNANTSRTTGESEPVKAVSASKPTDATIQGWLAGSQRRRSTRSTNAPPGSASRNAGRAEAVCTSAVMSLPPDSVVMNQAAATSVIHMHKLPPIQTDRSKAKGRLRSALHSVTGALPNEAPPVPRR